MKGESGPLEAELGGPAIPRGQDKEPIFEAPWEARIFAIMVQLSRGHHVDWPRFSAALGAEIGRHPADQRTAGQYYRHWLAAAERLLESEGLLDQHGIAEAERNILAEFEVHDH